MISATNVAPSSTDTSTDTNPTSTNPLEHALKALVNEIVSEPVDCSASSELGNICNDPNEILDGAGAQGPNGPGSHPVIPVQPTFNAASGAQCPPKFR